MKKIILLIPIIYLHFSILSAFDSVDSLGMTNNQENTENYKVVDIITKGKPFLKKQNNIKKNLSDKINGYVRESLSFNKWIPPTDFIICKYDSKNKSISILETENEKLLIKKSRDAINKSPDWLKNSLIFTLAGLNEKDQERWAQIIIDARDPLVDEIAFCIAHSSIDYLESKFSFSEFFVENAELIYENDKSLDYVEVKDYGSALDDSDYYSTTCYRILTPVSSRGRVTYDTTYQEIPRSTYYYYIVHPKLTDEIPSYIDPNILEYNHQENISKDGYFWRNFFFNNSDNGFPVMKALLKNVKLAWDNGYGATNAMEMLNHWINESMPTFTSNNERPHQPMRIYRKHFGRCGEFSDMRMAAARTALIPCTSVASMSTDHVWNEFYLGRWIHWDDVINSPMIYENGWGKVFGSIYANRSDGYIQSVTKRYSDICKINITVTDNMGNYVDGAIVKLYMYNDQYQNYLYRSDNYGITNSEGEVIFEVGEDRKFYIRVISELGVFPTAGEMELLIESTQKYVNYSYNIEINQVKHSIDIFESEFPKKEQNSDFYLKYNFETLNEIKHAPIWHDDLRSDAYYYYEVANSGDIQTFIIDNLEELDDLSNINNYQYFEGNSDEDTYVRLPDDKDIYLVFANLKNIQNLQSVFGQIELINTDFTNSKDIVLKQNYPNPFNASTRIPFQVESSGVITIEIYNILGQNIRTLQTVVKNSGLHHVSWDACNKNGIKMPTGIYYYKLKGLNIHNQQMVLIK